MAIAYRAVFVQPWGWELPLSSKTFIEIPSFLIWNWIRFYHIRAADRRCEQRKRKISEKAPDGQESDKKETGHFL